MNDVATLIKLPDPRLREKSQKVPKEEDITRLVQRMEHALLEWEKTRPHEIGAALSAIQIAEPYRVVIIRQDFQGRDNKSFLTLINPEIVKFGGKIDVDYEGCLSVSDVYGLVPRYNKVHLRALGLDKKEIRIKAKGFLARVLQHEIDHTNGIVFIDRIKHNDAFYEIDKDNTFRKISHKKILETESLWTDS